MNRLTVLPGETVKRAPIDRTASRVIQSGTHYESRTGGESVVTFSVMPRIVSGGGHCDDLTGKCFGRFEVIGFAWDQKFDSKRGYRWVVRCQCGKFEYRYTKAIENGMNGKSTPYRSMCSYCHKIQLLKLRDSDPEKYDRRHPLL